MSEKNALKAEKINLTIDGRAVSVPKGTTVYTAINQLGIDVPIFCYQDRMPPFGACRVCLVEVEKMAKLQTSCTLEATEGMVVNTQNEMAVEGRKSVLEFLLINHPLDCPICDKGGECPLQDQTLKFGPGESRFFEEKRHFPKRKPLGPVLMLDRERCIACARCTRFGDEIAGDHALEFQDRGYKTEVCTPDGGPAESKFIGNTIMICPVGALTSDVYRFRARPWDNKPTPSTCTLCPVGCSLIIDSRDGEVMRTRSWENKEVNDIWLCDKGWFGYEYTNHPDRLTTPLIRRDGALQPASWQEALSLVAAKILEGKSAGKLGAMGGNPLTTEENYLFQKLMRQGAETAHIDHRVGMPIFSLNDEARAPGMEISIGECEELSFAILAGVDLTEEFPVIWLRLRQAINKGAKILFLGHFAPEIARFFEKTIVHCPGTEIETWNTHFSEIEKLASKGGKGALFVGSQYAASENRGAIFAEIEKLSKKIPGLSFNLLEGRGNSFGARFAGMHPELNPLGKPLDTPGMNALQMLTEASSSGWDFLYVAGANPATKFSKKLWKETRSNLKFLVVQDLFMTETAQQADVVLPALSFIEKNGTFLNIEGRVQKLHIGKDIPEGLYSDGEIFERIAQKLGFSLLMERDFADALTSERVHFPPSNKINSFSKPAVNNEQGLLVTFSRVLFDRGVRMEHNPHVRLLAKNPRVRIHPIDAFKRNVAEGNRISIKNRKGSITGIAKLDPKVAEGTMVLPLGFSELPVQNLDANYKNGMAVEIHSLFLAEEEKINAIQTT